MRDLPEELTSKEQNTRQLTTPRENVAKKIVNSCLSYAPPITDSFT